MGYTNGTYNLIMQTTQRNFVVTRGDSRIAITIARNARTAKLGRENRFLVDDPDSGHMLAYLLTKPLKTGLTYNDEGIYKFVLQEVTGTENDLESLRIADYYRFFPEMRGKSEKEILDRINAQWAVPGEPINYHQQIDPENNTDSESGKKVWL